MTDQMQQGRHPFLEDLAADGKRCAAPTWLFQG